MEEQGDSELALRHYDEGLALYQRADDAWGMAAVHNYRGILHQHEGRLAEAQDELESSAEIFQALDETWALGITRFNLANVAMARQDFEEAEDGYRASLAIALQAQVDGLALLLNWAPRLPGLSAPAYRESRTLDPALGEACCLPAVSGQRST